MNNAFEEFNVSSVRFRNRIIRSATHEGLTDDDGNPDERLIELYEGLCKGGVGGIITGYAAVRRDGKAPTDNMLMFDNDSRIRPYQMLTDSVHDHGVPIILQLAHCGRQTRESITGCPTVAPSPIKDWLYNESVPHELTEDEISDIIRSFVLAAERACKAGFDGIQIHAAHGYLLSSFLSPHMNHRKDEWGGSTENRFRIVRMIAEGVRSTVGDFPMLIKINCFEKSKDGIKTEEAVEIARSCEDAGFDGIEVSCGIMEEGLVMCRGTLPYGMMIKTNFRMSKMSKVLQIVAKPYIEWKMGSPEPLSMYNMDAASEIKKNLGIPVITVGGIKRYSDIQGSIQSGKCDAVSMSRPFIIEPDIVNRFRDGQEGSRCISCNKCLLRAEGYVLRCYLS